MTENEAVKVLEYTKRNCGMPEQGEKWKPNRETIAIDMAIKAIEEIQQYRAIGTVEEIKHYVRLAENTEQSDRYYGGGWIACEDRLPEQPEENPVFDGKPLELYLVSVKGADYVFRAFWNGKFFTDGWNKVDVVAWMPLPEPYRP